MFLLLQIQPLKKCLTNQNKGSGCKLQTFAARKKYVPNKCIICCNLNTFSSRITPCDWICWSGVVENIAPNLEAPIMTHTLDYATVLWKTSRTKGPKHFPIFQM